MATKRNYRKEYDNYHSKPTQIERRSMRNQARRIYEATYGDVPSGRDIDHRKPLVRGGTNHPGNLRPATKHDNRSFKRTRTARMSRG